MDKYEVNEYEVNELEEYEEKKPKRVKAEEYLVEYDDYDIVIGLLTAAQDADHDNRERAREAHLFVDKRDGQWEQQWWNANDGKPRYTFDMVNPILDQVTAEIEQSDFDVKVSPASGPASKETAMIFDGLIRNVETMSRAKDIYINSGRGAATSGFDSWMVSHRYADSASFDMDLVIDPIPNAIDRVWFDPASYLQSKADSQYAFVLHPMSVHEYTQRWPDGSKESVETDREGDSYYDKAEVVVVGQLFYVEKVKVELVLMSNGATYTVDDDYEAIRDEMDAEGIAEVKRRKAFVQKVCSRFFDATEFLEDEEDTVFDRVPVVPIYGNFKVVENKVIYNGAVEKLIDPQRVLNYSLSREIEEGALAPRAKYWMTATQTSGYEDTLATMNTNSDPVQMYNPDPEAPGAPQQNGGAMVNPGLRTISEAMRSLIGQTAGMFASNMGDNPGLQSGAAIERLQKKGDNGTIKYFRALEAAIATTGDILLRAIPKVYDTERTIRLLYEDGTSEMKVVNEPRVDMQTGRVVTLNDLSKGLYSVSCRAGPSFRSREQETIETIIEIARVDPSIISMAGDIMMNSIPTSSATQIGERKRLQMLSQGLIPESQMTDEEKQQQQAKAQQQGQQQDPNMVIAQAEQMKAQADTMQAQVNMQKLQLESTKIQLEMQKLQAEMQVDQAGVQIDSFKAETDRMNTQIKAQESGAKIQRDQVATQGLQIDNQIKYSQAMNPMPPSWTQR